MALEEYSEWEIIERPGYSGKKKAEKHAAWDAEYGEGNWRIAWQWNSEIVLADFAYQLYEDAYYLDSIRRMDIWRGLIDIARDVYDLEERDIESRLDYSIQQGAATHLQDIAIRRVVKRRGGKFYGTELIQIRGHNDYWGKLLGPGKVLFHFPEMIVVPHLKGWWDPNSIEDFYQSNKVLQVKVKEDREKD